MSGPGPKYQAMRAVLDVERQAEWTADGVAHVTAEWERGKRKVTREERAAFKRLPTAVEEAMKVRAFALFEAACRACWRDHFGRDDAIRTRDLIDGLAARCQMPAVVSAEAHGVREHRNDLVHLDRKHPPREMRLVTAALRRFLSHLPDGWGRP